MLMRREEARSLFEILAIPFGRGENRKGDRTQVEQVESPHNKQGHLPGKKGH